MNQLRMLVLSHQGFSFLEKISEQLTDLGAIGHCLSSKIFSSSSDERKLQITKAYETCTVNETTTLNLEAVLCELDILTKRFPADRFGVFTVWDGYCKIADDANRYLGQNACRAEAITLCQDKFKLRHTLRELGHSEVQSTNLDSANTLKILQLTGKKFFLKPRQGAASVNARALRSDDTFEQLMKLQEIAQQDSVMGNIVSTNLVVEEFIEGVEFAVEILGRVANSHWQPNHSTS